MNLLYVSSLALDSGPSPCAIRLAVWSIAALWIGYNVLDSPMRDE